MMRKRLQEQHIIELIKFLEETIQRVRFFF